MLLLIIISCYFYYTQYSSKQKNLLPFNDIIIKFGEIRYVKYIAKMESNYELKEINIKTVRVIISMT